MNGPEHYLEAERLVDLLDEMTGVVAQEEQGSPDMMTGVAMIAATMQAAQVHATLAHVAAQISDRYRDPTRQEFGHSDVDRAFYEATR